MSDKFTLTPKLRQLLDSARKTEWFAASDAAKWLPSASSATLRRYLSELVERGLLEKEGENKGVRYMFTDRSRLFMPFELGEYYKQDDSERGAMDSYNFSIFPAMQNTSLMSKEQMSDLQQATDTFRANGRNMSPALHQKELERFVIEFSWKSSKIEGNTYTLLDTEFLLRNGIEAIGKSKFEAKMIINHKNAYVFTTESIHRHIEIDVAYIEQVHRLVTDGLGVDQGIRNRIVGISGSVYSPLAMNQQLREQMGVLIQTINAKENPYEQALIAVLGLSYLQPFEDGNKRTARVFANSLLLRAGLAPLSYRSVDERDYKEATLIFYEQNSIQLVRDLFVEQYIYSATHYNIAEVRG